MLVFQKIVTSEDNYDGERFNTFAFKYIIDTVNMVEENKLSSGMDSEQKTRV